MQLDLNVKRLVYCTKYQYWLLFGCMWLSKQIDKEERQPRIKHSLLLIGILTLILAFALVAGVSTLTSQSFILSLEVPSDVRAGETVTLKMKYKNTSYFPAKLFSSFVPDDFIVTTSDGKEVWRLRRGVIPDVLLEKFIQPKGELEFSSVWKQVDNNGIPVQPGIYLVRGTLGMGLEYPPLYRETEARQIHIIE